MIKTVLIIIDGLGDAPIKELGNRTPLESAFIPNIHYIATKGEIGRINTVFNGFPIESMVCIMGLLGYEPENFYPAGRASFEALARGIPLNENDLVLRCNLISLDETKEIITDFTAGLITDNDAKKITSRIKLPFSNWELYPGQSYRNTLIIRNANVDPKTIKCAEPHMNIGKNIKHILPDFKIKSEINEALNDFLLDTRNQIKEMNIPDCKADMLWVWSPSIKPNWPSFFSRTGIKAGFVGALDFLHGIAMAADIDYDIIPGATGYIDTNYKTKGEYGIKYLHHYDFTLIHINATDEEAHQLNYMGKKQAIEFIDKEIIGTVLQELEKSYKDNYRIIVCGDHETRSTDGKHGFAPVPYALYGKDVKENNHSNTWNEKICNNYPAQASLSFLQSKIKP
ncbi:MAG TPA: alkaline phosphatase family protein [Chitinophagaceae bacterium]|jgi:2,3-bisphosphoglycerate-independent phosphoglycerate mutase|nr:2,3-bisphosphoglycerate-independent phosphoglycerate mutase [Chitinophagaceae bacterium]HNM33975.1 alkaline phosphatase family protein [Chitinophagaceae bacterium]HNN31420.1 alkaline phosphatase family protein [Chitinophagaceae bacterium]